jgi:phosphoribosylaminoimidazolecarboxamide formyltransferase/IMP cyclohydrolase
MDPAYRPPEMESRDVFGLRLEQRRDDARIDGSLLSRVATRRTDISESCRRDALVALVALKYTQSNSIVLAHDGQTIGIGAGQQSRIHCTRLACGKADVWWLRQHPRARELPFRRGLSRPERDNAIDGFVREDLTAAELDAWRGAFTAAPERLSAAERAGWQARLTDVTLASDAYIPFRDNVDRAAASGVTTVVQTGGSKNDAEVVAAADQHGMVMAMTGLRLFHH